MACLLEASSWRSSEDLEECRKTVSTFVIINTHGAFLVWMMGSIRYEYAISKLRLVLCPGREEKRGREQEGNENRALAFSLYTSNMIHVDLSSYEWVHNAVCKAMPVPCPFLAIQSTFSSPRLPFHVATSFTFRGSLSGTVVFIIYSIGFWKMIMK